MMPAPSAASRHLPRSLAVVAGLVLAAGLSAGSASAAPQVLGLVASNGFPTPLTCDEFECSAQFSSFCLQEARSSPPTGTSYLPTPGGSLSLIATAPDGATLRLPAETLRIMTAIGFTSVTMSLTQSTRAEIAESMGVAPEELVLTVEVGPAMSLIPAPVPGDSDPQTEEEIALATGPLRAVAQSLFDQPSQSADAARITTLLINSLPVRGRETAADRESLFEEIAALPSVDALSAEGIERARGVYAECRISVDSSSMFSMRECLRLRHADLMVRSNRAFWEQAGGS
jgi:hypothetical protein